MWVSAAPPEKGVGAGRAVPPEAGSGGRRLPPLLGFIVIRGYITLHDLHVFSAPSPCVDFNGEEQTKLNPFPLAEPLRGDTGGGIASFHWATP